MRAMLWYKKFLFVTDKRGDKNEINSVYMFTSKLATMALNGQKPKWLESIQLICNHSMALTFYGLESLS